MRSWSHPTGSLLALGFIAACTPTRGDLTIMRTDAGQGGETARGDAPPALGRPPGCQADCAPLPVIVDDPGAFVASGYAGDWKGIAEVSSAINPAACAPARAHADAVGACHHWIWRFSQDLCPTAVDPANPCPRWACVAWLKPTDLFVTDPQGRDAGLAIAPGATKVRFWAWAPTPTNVRFAVGSADEGFSASLDAQLTTTPQPFAIDIAGASYAVVNRGFQWCNNDGRFDSLEFFVDDIQWTARP